MNGYQEPETAKNYIDFLGSINGQIQQNILFAAISKTLPSSAETVMLDAACGTGWLASRLKPGYPKIHACDESLALIDYGKQHYPETKISRADLAGALPYNDGFFDVVILNMAAPDLENLDQAMKNLGAKLKINGKIIMTVPNPYLTFPIAAWKRSVFDVLLRRKPSLKIAGNYFGPKKISREFAGNKIPSHFYTIADYLTTAKQAGLIFERLAELKSQTDSKEFDLNYQMFRYPLIWLLEFRK